MYHSNIIHLLVHGRHRLRAVGRKKEVSRRLEAKHLGSGTVSVDISKKGLNRKEVRELTNLLRKNLMYQTPQPRFTNEDSDEPTHVTVNFVWPHYQRVLFLMHKAGGWILPPEERAKIMARHEKAARIAHGDGINYDLSHLDYGDLLSMHRELEGISEMAPFRQAIEDALKENDPDVHRN